MADPFAALGVDPSAFAPPPPASPSAGAGGIPTITVKPPSAVKSSGPDPFAALGIDTSQSFPKTADVQAAQPTVSTARGVAKNIGAGLQEGAAGIMNVLSDPFGNLVGKPLAAGIQFAHDALAPVFGYERFPAEVREGLVGDNVPQPGTRVVNAIDQAGGAPTPEQVPANGPAERIARKATGSGLSAAALGPGGIAPMATAGVTGAIVGDQVAQAVPDWAKPAAELGGNIAGGMAGVGAAHVAAAPFKAAANFAGARGIGPKTTIGQGDDAIRATNTQVQKAADTLSSAAGPQVEDFRAALNNNPETLVPGSNPTTGQLTGQAAPGIAALEQSARLHSDQFKTNDQAQNSARIGSIQGLAPADAAPASVGELFSNRLQELDNAGTASIQAAQRGVTAQSEALGAHGTPQSYSAGMRGHLEAALEPVQAARRALWQAVDPNGTLALPVAPVREMANSLLGELSPSDTLSPSEGRVINAASSMPDVVRFSDLTALRSNIGDALRGAANGEPLTTRGMRRLTMLRNAVDDAISQAAEGVASNDPVAGERINAALASSDGRGTASGGAAVSNEPFGPGAAESVSGGTRNEGAAGVEPGGISSPEQNGLNRTGAGLQSNVGSGLERGNGAGLAPGNSELAPVSATRGRAPESLVDYLIAKGGIQDQTGDLVAIGADTIHHRAGGRLVNPRGLSPDYARELAEGEGFLPPNSTIADLYDAIAEHAAGRPVYRPEEAEQARSVRQAASETGREAQLRDAAEREVSEVLSRPGADRLNQGEYEHAVQLRMQGAHPEEAVLEAARGRDEEVLQRNAERNAIGSPGVPPGASQAEMPIGGGLKSNFGPEAAQRYAAARRATVEEKETFGQGPVGKVLSKGRNGEPYRVADADVARQFFSGGTREPADVQKFIQAVGGKQEAVQTARDYLVSELRNNQAIFKPDGTLNADAFAKWQQRRGQTIDLFPGLKGEFSSLEAAQRTVDAATEAHVEALKNFQDATTKSFIHDDPLVAIRKAFASGNPTETFTRLANAVRGNADAEAGLRRGVVNYILEKMSSVTPGAGEENFLNAAQFQKWVRTNKEPLRILFGGQGMNRLEMVAADLRRASQKVASTPGSDTAQKIFSSGRHGMDKPSGHGDTLMAVLGSQIGEHLAEHMGAGGILGAAMTIGGGAAMVLARSMRQAGIKTVQDLVAQAMLHPEVARQLAARIPPSGKVPSAMYRRLATALQATIAADLAHATNEKQ